MDGFGVDLQRTISSSSARRSLVSSRMMPAPAAARESGRRARNSCAFLACCALRDHAPPPPRRTCALALRGRLQHIENGIELLAGSPSAAATLPARNSPASMARVGVAHVFEHRGQRLGGIQIVVQAVVETPARLPPCAPPAPRSRPPGYLSVSRRSLKLRSRSIAVAADFQPVESEIQLLAVRHRRQQIADRLRAHSPCASRSRSV